MSIYIQNLLFLSLSELDDVVIRISCGPFSLLQQTKKSGKDKCIVVHTGEWIL